MCVCDTDKKLCHQLTPWRRVFLENLIVAYMLKAFSATQSVAGTCSHPNKFSPQSHLISFKAHFNRMIMLSSFCRSPKWPFYFKLSCRNFYFKCKVICNLRVYHKYRYHIALDGLFCGPWPHENYASDFETLIWNVIFVYTKMFGKLRRFVT
jgi:hypothetical protein